MKRTNKLFWIVLFVILAVSVLTLVWNKQDEPETTLKPGEAPISAAQTLFRQRLAEGMSMENGPCLTNDLKPGWVVDIVHNPRQTVDDLEENQCAAYMEGRAQHFIELDLKGNIVRVK